MSHWRPWISLLCTAHHFKSCSCFLTTITSHYDDLISPYSFTSQNQKRKTKTMIEVRTKIISVCWQHKQDGSTQNAKTPGDENEGSDSSIASSSFLYWSNAKKESPLVHLLFTQSSNPSLYNWPWGSETQHSQDLGQNCRKSQLSHG